MDTTVGGGDMRRTGWPPASAHWGAQQLRFPRKIVADVAYLTKLPDLLRAFIRFCHAERGIRADRTADTLAALDEYEPAYQRLIRSDRPQGPAAILAAMGAPGSDDTMWDDPESDDELDFEALVARYRGEILDRLRDMVGGEEALAGIDDTPLPDEDFSWAGIPADIRDKVAEILQLCDDSCDALLDVEHRTAARRLLATVASSSPEVFRRRGAAKTAAAALCWVVAKQNLSFSQSSGGLTAKALAAQVGVTGSTSQRAATLLGAAGLGPDYFPAEFLTGSRRAGIMRLRDDHTATAGGREGLGGVGRSATVHRLKVDIADTSPPIWRRIEVPSDVRLSDLHEILQVAFDWEGYHLHEFEIDRRRYAPPSEFDLDFGPPPVDESTVTLAEVADVGSRFDYTYDFGDGWLHRIAVEAITPRSSGQRYPTCLAGRRAAPPENVGGPWGFRGFLAALADQGHPDHDERVEWFGDAFDPTDFDADELDDHFGQLWR